MKWPAAALDAQAEVCFDADIAPAARLAPASLRPADIAITVSDSLAAVEAEWRRFEQTADCTVFQSFDWLDVWQQCVGARIGANPAIVTGRDPGGEILFLMPLAVCPAAFARQLCWLGTDLCDYNAPLLARNFSARLDQQSFEAVWARILRRLSSEPRFRPDLIRLEKMPAKIGSQDNPFLTLGVRENASRAYSTPLAPSWEAFYAAKRSAGTRRRDRNKRKRLAEYGEITLDTAANAADAAVMIDALVEQKSRAFAQQGVPNLFRRPGVVEFCHALTGNCGNGTVHVSALRIGSAIAAANVGLLFRGCYHHYLTSYDDGEWSRFGPGAVHLHELMRFAIENGCTVFDFTIGDEPYKRDWCEDVQILYDRIAVVTGRGALAYLRIMAFLTLKRLIKRTPLLWSIFSGARSRLAAWRTPDRG